MVGKYAQDLLKNAMERAPEGARSIVLLRVAVRYIFSSTIVIEDGPMPVISRTAPSAFVSA